MDSYRAPAPVNLIIPEYFSDFTNLDIYNILHNFNQEQINRINKLIGTIYEIKDITGHKYKDIFDKTINNNGIKAYTYPDFIIRYGDILKNALTYVYVAVLKENFTNLMTKTLKINFPVEIVELNNNIYQLNSDENIINFFKMIYLNKDNLAVSTGNIINTINTYALNIISTSSSKPASAPKPAPKPAAKSASAPVPRPAPSPRPAPTPTPTPTPAPQVSVLAQIPIPSLSVQEINITGNIIIKINNPNTNFTIIPRLRAFNSNDITSSKTINITENTISILSLTKGSTYFVSARYKRNDDIMGVESPPITVSIPSKGGSYKKTKKISKRKKFLKSKNLRKKSSK